MIIFQKPHKNDELVLTKEDLRLLAAGETLRVPGLDVYVNDAVVEAEERKK